MSSVHVHSPRPHTVLRRILRCYRCKARRRHVVQAFEWYGAIVTCCTCGEGYTGDARMLRGHRSKMALRRAERARVAWKAVRDE